MKSIPMTGATLALGALLASASIAAPVHAAAPAVQAEANETTLNIQGNAMQQLAPDYAMVTFGLSTKGASVSQAKNTNDAIMSRLIANVQSLGIRRADIATTNFSVNPNYTYENGNQSDKITSYTVNNFVTIRINDLRKVSALIDAAANSGITNIESLRFLNEDSTQSDDLLMRDAVKDARHKAEVLAAALGLKIVGIKSVSINPTYTENNYRDSVFLARSMASTTTPIEQGQIKATKSVNITYLLGH